MAHTPQGDQYHSTPMMGEKKGKTSSWEYMNPNVSNGGGVQVNYL